jgi:hypothetical protein
MALQNVNYIAELLAALGFRNWQSIQEPYKGSDGLIEYPDGVVECAAHENSFRVTKNFPVRRSVEYVAKDLATVLKKTSRAKTKGGAA